MQCIRDALRVPRTWNSLFEQPIVRAAEPKAWPCAKARWNRVFACAPGRRPGQVRVGSGVRQV
jgi:hypothetical protein